MQERRQINSKELYSELLESGAVLNREGIDKVKKEGGKIGTVYLNSDYELACKIELTPDCIEKFSMEVSTKTGQNNLGDEYATILELGKNEFAFVKKGLIKAEGKTTLQEFKDLLNLYPWLTKTHEFRIAHQHLYC